MTGFTVSVFPFRNRVSPNEAFEGLELGEGKPSRPVLRGPGGRKAAWLLGSYSGPKVRLGKVKPTHLSERRFCLGQDPPRYSFPSALPAASTQSMNVHPTRGKLRK